MIEQVTFPWGVCWYHTDGGMFGASWGETQRRTKWPPMVSFAKH